VEPGASLAGGRSSSRKPTAPSKKKLEFSGKLADKECGGSPGILTGYSGQEAPKLILARVRLLGAKVHNLIPQFLRVYQSRLKHSTLTDYRSILNHHISRFSGLQDLNVDLEDYLSSLEISGKRKNNILCACRTFVTWATRRQLLHGEFLKIPKFPHRTRKTKPLNADQASQVMNYSAHPYRDFFTFSILSGLRTGEALGLRFEDFDQVGRLIKIRRSLTCGKVSTTKTLSSDREVPLSRPLWDIYERRRQGNGHGSPWFFYSPHRGLMSLGAIRKAWKDCLSVFEIESRPLYATRHTFASLSIAAGEDPLYIAKVMGHGRPDQLFLKYASYLEGVKKDGQKFLELVGKRSLLRAAT
jgi:integrase